MHLAASLTACALGAVAKSRSGKNCRLPLLDNVIFAFPGDFAYDEKA